MATCSSILAWRIPWIEEPDELLLAMGSPELDRTKQLTHTHTHTHPRARARASYLVAQAVKNLPAMQETQVGPLVGEDFQERGMATHSCILAWRIHMDRGAW